MNRVSGRSDVRPEPMPLLYGPFSLSELVDRVCRSRSIGGRSILGIAGEPGSGKSIFCEQLVEAINARISGFAVGVSMDGFHLAQHVLDERDQANIKGAIETFDASGFVNFLKRTREEMDDVVWWPEFRRDLEESVASSLRVAPEHKVVVVDGNFLLDMSPIWREVRPLLTESWFLQSSPLLRQARLISRYVEYGFSVDRAEEKSRGIDEITSARIRENAHLADLVLREGA